MFILFRRRDFILKKNRYLFRLLAKYTLLNIEVNKEKIRHVLPIFFTNKAENPYQAHELCLFGPGTATDNCPQLSFHRFLFDFAGTGKLCR